MLPDPSTTPGRPTGPDVAGRAGRQPNMWGVGWASTTWNSFQVLDLDDLDHLRLIAGEVAPALG